MKKKIFTIACLIVTVLNTYSKEFGELNNTHIALGSFSEFMGKVQTSVEGEKNSYDFKPYLGLGADAVLYEDISFIPELILTLPEKGRDENISRFTFITLFTFGYHFKDFLFKFGSGFAFTRLSSNGGTETLNNGTNPSEDFFLPDGSSTSRNMLLTAGIQYFIHKNWSVQASGLLYNLTDSQSRAWSSLISINFHLDKEMMPSW